MAARGQPPLIQGFKLWMQPRAFAAFLPPEPWRPGHLSAVRTVDQDRSARAGRSTRLVINGSGAGWRKRLLRLGLGLQPVSDLLREEPRWRVVAEWFVRAGEPGGSGGS